MSMKLYVDPAALKAFAESLAKDANEAIKWERRKLEWIVEEEKTSKPRSEAH